MSYQQKSIIKASEIGEYLYCKRGWWLMQKGLPLHNDAMQEGSVQHLALSKNVFKYKTLFIVAIITFGLGLAIIISLILEAIL